jgi:hypothetical protein
MDAPGDFHVLQQSVPAILDLLQDTGSVDDTYLLAMIEFADTPGSSCRWVC